MGLYYYYLFRIEGSPKFLLYDLYTHTTAEEIFIRVVMKFELYKPGA